MRKAFFILSLFVFVPSSALAFRTEGFQNPYGVVVDEQNEFIYVSNINGGYDLRDGNGFISKLNIDGTVNKMRFIGGASEIGVTLHSPKGMALVGSRLYVADIDQLRVFDLEKSRFLYNINFGDFPVQHFIDLDLGPDGALYVTDGPASTIYRIDVDRQHEVAVFASGVTLGQPHGICWYSTRQFFVVDAWGAGSIVEIDRAGKQQVMPAILVDKLEGCAADSYGNIYVSSESLNTVFRVAPNFALFGFALGQLRPAGLEFYRAKSELIVATVEGNAVQSFPIEPPR